MPTATPVESLVAVLAMALIAVLCRWVFSPVHPPVRRDPADADYGLLTGLLVAEGIRASVGSGHEVLVFHTDVDRARTLVAS